MTKKPINEINIAGFIGKFLTDIQNGTQKRFIDQAKKKGVPKEITIKLTTIEKEIKDLENILKDL